MVVPEQKGGFMGQKVVNKKIGEMLIEAEKLTEENLQKALEAQKSTNKRLGEILVEMELVTEEDLIVQLAVQYQYPFINLDNYEIPKDILGLIPKGLALKYFCLPLDRIGNMISFVVSDPGNLYDLKQQESFLNCKMQFFVTTPSLLKKGIEKYYGTR
jgi:type IV pilus assembly protein PilB